MSEVELTLAMATAVLADAGERNKEDALVGCSAAPCCGMPLAEKRIRSSPSTGKVEVTMAHPVTATEAAPVE